MRVLFVLPRFSLGREPLGILYLSSALKARGHQTMATRPSHREVLKSLSEFQPHIVAFSLVTYHHRPLLELARWIKENARPAPFVLVGGPHVTAWPDVIQDDAIDGACLGEGEEAFVELVDCLENNERPTQIKNWLLKWDGISHTNSVRPYIKDLDGIPFPDRNLLAEIPGYKGIKTRSFMAIRGCPYDCAFCFNHAYRSLYAGNPPVRRRSTDNVLAEIRQVREEYDFDSIAFHDDLFITYSDWLEEFSIRYRAEVGLPFSCHVRAELVTPEVAEHLGRAGCAVARMGIEIADAQKRKQLLNRRMTNEQILRACELLKANGIRVQAYNIVGLPQTTLDDDWATLNFNIECKVDIATASIFHPYPTTELGKLALRSGLWDGNIELDARTPAGICIMDLAHKGEVEMLQRLFFWCVKYPAILPVAEKMVSLAGTAPSRKLLPLATKIGDLIALQQRFRDGSYHK